MVLLIWNIYDNPMWWRSSSGQDKLIPSRSFTIRPILTELAVLKIQLLFQQIFSSGNIFKIWNSNCFELGPINVHFEDFFTLTIFILTRIPETTMAQSNQESIQESSEDSTSLNQTQVFHMHSFCIVDL